MDFIIVTGLSGAGKSLAIDVMEDIGFFCIDNMPPTLISKFAEICLQSEGKISRVAIVTDIRGGELYSGLFAELDELKAKDFEYRLLFLDASDNVLINRYKETRRKHPLIENSVNIEDAVRKEREIVMPARERADYVIDTSLTSAQQLREKIFNLFLDNISDNLVITCTSFGFKYGIPAEADLVFDVRCLPNPFYIDALKHKTGLDQEVRDYVMSFPQAVELKEKLLDLIDYQLPLFHTEGKSQLVIAFGCTGGKHRSVTFAELTYAHLLDGGNRVSVHHRDIMK